MRRTAVVLIHGIGEQHPMGTVRPFVRAVLPAEDGRPSYFSKPDPMSELFELRRLQAVGRKKYHFYEYYWAYNVEGTKVLDVLAWLYRLIIRPWRDIPASTKALWVLARVLAVPAIVTSALGGVDAARHWYSDVSTNATGWFLATGLILAAQYFLISYLGDAARYLSPRPRNIALRQKIRSEGLKLLRTLHDSGEYDRIVVVGHSLGSVIGYDLIARLWQEYNTRMDGLDDPDTRRWVRDCMARHESPQPAVHDAISRAGAALSAKGGDVGRFRQLQEAAWREQRRLGNPWRITDFITLGSPLTHAMLLLAGGKKDFEARKRERELPTCPPRHDRKGYGYGAPRAYDVGEGKRFTPLVLHHAAPFAVTRWTNLYFPCAFGLFGDFIGGPLAPVLGYGIKDVAVCTASWRGLAARTLAAHTRYWHPGDGILPPREAGGEWALAALKAALGL